MKKALQIALFFGLSFLATPNDGLIYPPTSPNQEIIRHTYYIFAYSNEHKQAQWVYYQINTGSAKRINRFSKDPKLPTQLASSKDYINSGYDRGHLAPAASMSINELAMDESFYISNIAPQHPSFNRGKWQELENLVRKWGQTDNSLHIIVGTIFLENPPTIGKNKISVPAYFYKVIYSPQHQKMIAFLLENKKLTQDLNFFIVPVDLIEEYTNLDLFSQLNDDLENRLEATLPPSHWSF